MTVSIASAAKSPKLSTALLALVATTAANTGLEPILDVREIETTEQKAVRLLAVASDPNQSLTTFNEQVQGIRHDEICLYAELIADRVQGWRQLAEQLEARAKAAHKEAERMQQLVEKLSQVAAQFTQE